MAYVNEETAEEVVETPVTEQVEERVTEVETPVEEKVSEPESNVTQSEEKIGVVTDCEQLNVRVLPSVEGNVVCVIGSGAHVIVSEGESTEEWLKVCTEAGAEGFCMRKFIAVE